MRTIRLLATALCLATLSACGLTKPKPVKREPQGTVSVKVDAPGAEKISIYLAAYPMGSNKEVASYRVKDGSVTGFILPADGIYEIRAFVDRAGTGKPVAGESVGKVSGVKPDPDVHAAAQTLQIVIPPSPNAKVPPAEKKLAPAPAAASQPGKTQLIKEGLDKVKEAAPGLPLPPSPGN